MLHHFMSEHFLRCHETHEFNYRDVDPRVKTCSFLQGDSLIVVHLSEQEGLLLQSYREALEHTLGRLIPGCLADVLVHNPKLASAIITKDQK